jgi:hypothetical protein
VKGFRGLPQLRYTKLADAHKKAKRSDEAECSEEGRFRGLTQQRYNTTRPRKHQAKSSGEEDLFRLQHNTPTPPIENKSEFEESQKVWL